MVLTGLQIKSIRSKKVNIDYAYCSFDSNELFLHNVNFENSISNSKNDTIKLLLNKRELNKIEFDKVIDKEYNKQSGGLSMAEVIKSINEIL